MSAIRDGNGHVVIARQGGIYVLRRDDGMLVVSTVMKDNGGGVDYALDYLIGLAAQNNNTEVLNG